jgi:alpha-L-fucosidase
MRGAEKYRTAKHDWKTYLKYMHGQIQELTTQYGKLDIMWFDFSYGEMKGEKWKAKELVQMVRKNQPGIILNNRLSGDGTGRIGDADALGDFETPEQGVPDSIRLDSKGAPVAWETCLTLNNNWGYHSTDNEWKTPELIVHTLVNCVSKGGNLLLNVGPDGRGRIPEASANILRQVGAWMSRNGESIYGCSTAALPKPEWGRYTQKGKLLYAHVMHPHIGHINLKSLYGRVAAARLLRDKTEAYMEETWWGDHTKNNVFINVKKPTYMHYNLPDKINTVFEVELK